MPRRATGRTLTLILVALAAIGALIALLWWLNQNEGASRPVPAAPVGNTATALPTATPRSAQEEIACFDRLAAGNVPEGINIQAAFERCRYVPAPDANMADTNMSGADRPAPVNGSAAR